MYFRGINLKNYFNILDIRRNILPPQNIKRNHIPGRAGSVFVKQEHLENTIEVDIEIKGDNKKHLRTVVNDLASKLVSEQPGKLIFTDEPDKYYLAVLEGDTRLNEFYLFGTTTLVFLCPDPIRYGKTAKVPITGTQIFYSLGTYETIGVLTIKITENINYLRVTRKDSGNFIYLNDKFNIGDEIVIDFEKQYIRKNGYLIMDKLTLESDFFSIPVGECTISLSSGKGELKFVERWL